MELLTLVNTRDEVIGSCEKAQAHAAPTLHRAFSVFLYSDKGMLLQRRSRGKYHSGGLWTNACCSHPRYGETLSEAVPRRMEEELGWSEAVQEIFSFVYCAQFAPDLWEYEYDHVFLGPCDRDPVLNPEEAEEFRWVEFEALRRELVEHPEQFTAWFLIAAPRVLDFLEWFGR